MSTPVSFRFQGLTLTELLAVLAVAAVLAGLVAPGFASLRHHAALTAAADELLGALYFAQSTAARTGIPAAVCLLAPSPVAAPGGTASAPCSTVTGVPAQGWLSFLDNVRTAPVQLGGDDTRLSEVRLNTGIEIRGTRSAVTFWPAARAGTTSTFTLCDPRDRSTSLAVIVSETGRPRVASAPGAACSP